MTQYASSQFVEIYDRQWSGFAVRTAPIWYRLLRYRMPAIPEPVVLDVCCGTGQLAAYLLDQGCRVLGIDGSSSMLDRARANCANYVDSGRAEFLLSDATDFMLPEPVDCAFSTYDSLNHLPDTAALRACFTAVNTAVKPGGLFAFDLKTRGGVRGWNSITVAEDDDWMLVTQGVVNDDVALRRVTGFLRDGDGHYTRFHDIMSQRWFPPEIVIELLEGTGWHDIYIADPTDLSSRGTVPTNRERFFVVARNSG
jgi:SAM-dependent methyltransferase